jgi:hypothetical protein
MSCNSSRSQKNKSLQDFDVASSSSEVKLYLHTLLAFGPSRAPVLHLGSFQYPQARLAGLVKRLAGGSNQIADQPDPPLVYIGNVSSISKQDKVSPSDSMVRHVCVKQTRAMQKKRNIVLEKPPPPLLRIRKIDWPPFLKLFTARFSIGGIYTELSRPRFPDYFLSCSRRYPTACREAHGFRLLFVTLVDLVLQLEVDGAINRSVWFLSGQAKEAWQHLRLLLPPPLDSYMGTYHPRRV